MTPTTNGHPNRYAQSYKDRTLSIQESRGKDHAEAMHEFAANFARPDIAREFVQLASDAKRKGEEEDAGKAMGQVIQRYHCLLFLKYF